MNAKRPAGHCPDGALTIDPAWRLISSKDSNTPHTSQASRISAWTVQSAAGAGRAFGIEIELPSTIDEIEKQVIEAMLDYTEGDKSRAARLLNIGRKTLYRKLEQYESKDG